MRSRALSLAALLLLPAVSSAQLRVPRTTRGTPPTAAPLPPEAPVVARALALKRSRWSFETYSLIDAVQVPDATGNGVSSYGSFGTGTHGDYRYSDHWSATVDLTASVLGSPQMAATAEVGTRYRVGPLDRQLRPYFDVRGAFIESYDTFNVPSTTGAIVSGIGQGNQFAQGQRYSRGFGGVTGAGFDFAFTNSFALTSELLAMRDRMTTYRLDSPATLPNATRYWMTTFRYVIGFKYNPTRVLNLAQNPLH